MNKNTKILITILVVFTILLSYTAYSDISSSSNTSNIKPKMLSEKQILNLCHFHNCTSYSYSNTSNFIYFNNSYVGNSLLKVFHNTSYNADRPLNINCCMFIDFLTIFNNKTDLSQCVQKLINRTGLPNLRITEKVVGKVNFTFYACGLIVNSSFINSIYNEYSYGATTFFAVNGTKLIDFFIPFNMLQIYTVFTNLAEILFINAKNITYSALNQKSIFF